MSSEASFVAIDGTDALACIVIRPGQTPGTVIRQAWAKGISQPAAAYVLREIANGWSAPPGYSMVLEEIAAERVRQDERWGEQNHPDGTGQYPEQVEADAARVVCQQAAEGGYLDWLHILREETAEAFAESDPVRLRAELVQVAAVAVAWIQAIDRRLQQAAALDTAAADEEAQQS